MSTKNVALNSRVYERLSRFKRESESFSRAIDRLLTVAESRHSGADIFRGLEELPALSEADTQKMLKVVDANRSAERWERRDLR
jgi:predicted CopG family antitoxin